MDVFLLKKKIYAVVLIYMNNHNHEDITFACMTGNMIKDKHINKPTE